MFNMCFVNVAFLCVYGMYCLNMLCVYMLPISVCCEYLHMCVIHAKSTVEVVYNAPG